MQLRGPRTGCCVRSPRPSRPDRLSPESTSVLADQWPGPCYAHCDCREPFGDEFPGLVGAPDRVGDAISAAAGLAGRWMRRHLALVPVARPADVPAAVGWPGTCNHRDDVVGLGAVLRSWEDRFGARLVVLDRATLWVSVAAPPRTTADCLGVAAEHFSFCRDVDGEDPRSLRVYASTLHGNPMWRFWWD